MYTSQIMRVHTANFVSVDAILRNYVLCDVANSFHASIWRDLLRIAKLSSAPFSRRVVSFHLESYFRSASVVRLLISAKNSYGEIQPKHGFRYLNDCLCSSGSNNKMGRAALATLLLTISQRSPFLRLRLFQL